MGFGDEEEDRECGSHNVTLAFNCHMSYLIANLMVMSLHILKLVTGKKVKRPFLNEKKSLN